MHFKISCIYTVIYISYEITYLLKIYNVLVFYELGTKV